MPLQTMDPDLRALRSAAGLSVRGLAAYSGLSPSYLSRVESGKRAVTAELAQLYASLPNEVDPRYRAARPEPAARPWPGAADLGFTLLGAEVRRLRTREGRSLRSMSQDSYISHSQLDRIEQGIAVVSESQARSLDRVLGTGERFQALARERGPRPKIHPADVDLLMRPYRRHTESEAADCDEAAALAGTRLESLRVRCHRSGPHSVVADLQNGLLDLHHRAAATSGPAKHLLRSLMISYAELIGWVAQETGHDAIALRWTRVALNWARVVGDADAEGYLLVRQSQWHRRHGDVGSALENARTAGALPAISPRIRLFAAQREAQACALARNAGAFRSAFGRYAELCTDLVADTVEASGRPVLGPRPDPVFDRSGVFEACCLIDLGDLPAAAELFDRGMPTLGAARNGYARLAMRQGIVAARLGDPARACEIVVRFLPVVARQGSASLRGDLRLLARALKVHRGRPDVEDLLPYVTVLARTAGVFPIALDQHHPEEV